MIAPIVPIQIPMMSNKPSFPKRPNEMINMPNPGKKFDKKTGINTHPANIKMNTPMILSEPGESMNGNRGFNTLSTLLI